MLNTHKIAGKNKRLKQRTYHLTAVKISTKLYFLLFGLQTKFRGNKACSVQISEPNCIMSPNFRCIRSCNTYTNMFVYTAHISRHSDTRKTKFHNGTLKAHRR